MLMKNETLFNLFNNFIDRLWANSCLQEYLLYLTIEVALLSFHAALCPCLTLNGLVSLSDRMLTAVINKTFTQFM